MPPRVTHINPPALHAPVGYSHITSAPTTAIPSRVSTISGQLGLDADGNLAPTFAGQVAQAFSNLRACLDAVGAAPADVMKLTFYVVGYDASEHQAPLGEQLVALFGDGDDVVFPASTLVGVQALAAEGVVFEVDALVAVPEQRAGGDGETASAAGVSAAGPGAADAKAGGKSKDADGAATVDVDVVVVGAGLSGLRAAAGVQAAGLTCAVLEAEHRVGGKTLSVASHGADGGRPGTTDIGAAWINDSNQSEVYALARRLGLELEVQRIEGNGVRKGEDGSVVVYPATEPPIREEDAGALLEFMGIIGEEVEEVDLANPHTSPKATELDNMTMEQFWKEKSGHEAVKGLLDMVTRALLGVEADEVSALYFLSYCRSNCGLDSLLSSEKDGGQYLRARQGMQSLSQGLAKQLAPGTIHLATPVTSITQDPATHTVTTTTASTSRTFRSRKVIVSVPTTLYPTIAFSPPLPAAKRTLAATSTLGYFSKVVLVWDRPWWRAAQLTGSFQAAITDPTTSGPASFGLETSIPADNQWSISCFVVGEPGRRWSKLPRAARERRVIDQVRGVFGEGGLGLDVPEPANVIEMEWAKKERFLGAPVPVTGLGALASCGHALRERHGDVHFVGTETAEVWKGYMDGALRSGDRGAKEVVEGLRPKARL